MHCKRSFPLISFLYPDVVEPSPEIHFREHFLASHIVN